MIVWMDIGWMDGCRARVSIEREMCFVRYLDLGSVLISNKVVLVPVRDLGS